MVSRGGSGCDIGACTSYDVGRVGVPARDVLKSSGVPVAVGVVVKGVRGAASNERDSDVLESRRVLVALMVVEGLGACVTSRRAERAGIQGST